MGNRTERDLAPDPREMPRRRFMIAAIERRDDRSHIGHASIHDLVIFSVFRDGAPQQEAS